MRCDELLSLAREEEEWKDETDLTGLYLTNILENKKETTSLQNEQHNKETFSALFSDRCVFSVIKGMMMILTYLQEEGEEKMQIVHHYALKESLLFFSINYFP